MLVEHSEQAGVYRFVIQHAAEPRSDDGQDAVSRARHQRHEGVAALPRHHDVRRADRARPRRGASSTMRWRAASTSSTRPTSTPRGARRRSSAPPSRPSATAGCWRPRWRSRRGPTSPMRGLSRRHIDAGRRGEPEAAADRPHRPLLHPPRRSRHGLGADHRRLRRPDPPGQDPRVGRSPTCAPGTSRTSSTSAASSACRRRPRCSPTTTS